MARGSGSKSGISSDERDLSTPITNDPLMSLLGPAPLPLPTVTELLSPLVEDLRTFVPDVRPPQSPVRPAGARAGRSTVPASLGFSEPHKVGVCVRRKIRREVMFAYRKTRKGAGARRRRNEWSNTHC